MRLRLLSELSTIGHLSATLIALPLLAFGLLSAVVSIGELVLDIAASKSKAGFAARARLHRLVTLSRSSRVAHAALIASFIGVPITLLGTAGAAFALFASEECGLACALPAVQPCFALDCEWTFKVALSALLVFVQV